MQFPPMPRETVRTAFRTAVNFKVFAAPYRVPAKVVARPDGAGGWTIDLPLPLDGVGSYECAEPRLAARVQLRDSITITVAATRGFQSLSMLRDERTLLPGASFWFIHPRAAPTSRPRERRTVAKQPASCKFCKKRSSVLSLGSANVAPA